MTASDADRARKTAVDAALRSLFARLEARPVPDRILSVVNRLEAPPRPAARRAAGR